MFINKKNKKNIFYGSLLLIMILVLSSCNNNTNNNFEPPVPTPPLFNRLIKYETSIYSGNFLYNNFIASDFENIYFQGKDNTSLYKADYTGANKEMLINTQPYNINIVGDQIFFMDEPTSSMIHKINNDGTGHLVISNLRAKHFVVEYLYIFFINESDNYAYKALHDGNEISLVLEKEIDMIYISYDKVFLVSYSEGVYVVNIDIFRDVEDEPLSENDYTFIEIQEGFEFLNVNEKTMLYKLNNDIFMIDLDSKTKTSFTHKDLIDSINPFIISFDSLYFINPNDKNRVYSLNINNPDEINMIVNDMVNEFVVLGNSIYYRRENTRDIYRVSISGGYSSKVT